MPEYPRTTARTWSERVYRALLRLYPRALRDEFGDAMNEFFRDRMARARLDPNPLSRLHVWLRVALDLARNAVPSHLDAVRHALRAHRQHRLAPITAPSLNASRREDHVFSSILQDIRFAMRGMQRAPAFTLTVLVTLAIGIGASVAVFSVVNGVLLKPLPYPEPHRIVRVEHTDPYGTVSEPEFVDYKRETRALSLLAGYVTGNATLASSNGEPERVRVTSVSEDFFSTLGSRMWLGRSFTAEENRRGGPFAVVMSHGLWQRRYGADSSIIGKTIVMNNRPRTVVGVLPPGVEFPAPDIGLWAPLRLNYDTLWTRNNHYLELIGRLAPGASVEQARVQIAELARRFGRDFPDVYDPARPLLTRVATLSNAIVADTRPYIVTLFVAVTFVLLIACANVANLMLSRGESRRREVAIRTAMGASRFRVVRQALTESLLFAVVGGAAGLSIAVAIVNASRATLPASVPRAGDIAVDVGVLLFALGITLITGVLCGVVPAFRVAQDDASDTLKEGGRSAGSARGRGRVRRSLVVAEIALAVVTLSGAGLMLRSLWNMQSIDLGFEPEHVLAVQIAPAVPEDNRASQLYERILERVRAIPDVVHAGAVQDLPITDGNSMWSILVDGAQQTSVANEPAAMPQKVTHGYFDAMRIPVLRGRTFTADDRVDAPLVAVINETMARKLWPGRDAIGGTVKLLNETLPWVTVVGVVKDVRSSGFLTDPPPTMYFPQTQAGRSAWYVPSTMWLIVRTNADPRAVAGQIRSIVREIDAAAPIARVQTMNEAVAASVAPRRFTTLLLLGFAVVAMILAGLGIYSVIGYSVSQRRAEMGIRMALGASRSKVVGQVLGEGIRTGAVGSVVGLVIAFATTRLLRALVVGVSPTDALTLGSVSGSLMLVAIAAAYIPARRASRVDPVQAIRAD